MKKLVHFSDYIICNFIILYNLKDINKEVFFLKIFFLDDNFLVGIMKLHIERCFSSKQTEFSETRQLNIVAFYLLVLCFYTGFLRCSQGRIQKRGWGWVGYFCPFPPDFPFSLFLNIYILLVFFIILALFFTYLSLLLQHFRSNFLYLYPMSPVILFF